MVTKYNYRDIEEIKKDTPYISEIIVEFIQESNPDLSFLEQDYNDVEDEQERQKYVEEDKKILEDYNNQQWYMMGIMAKACIKMDYIGYPSNYTQHIGELHSGGIWGISSLDNNLINEEKERQIKELKKIIKKMNIK